MKRLTLALAVAAATSSMVSADDSVETITVTASRGANVQLPTLATHVVIERADIELAQVESVPELLSRYAGIDVATNGGRQASGICIYPRCKFRSNTGISKWLTGEYSKQWWRNMEYHVA